MTDGSNASRRSFRRTVAVIAVAGSMLVATAADAAVGVLTKNRFQEVSPGVDRVGNKLFLGWAQAPRSHPSRLKVLVKRGNRKPIRLNRPSTIGFMGGIDGQVAVYQEIKNGDSNILRYNLKTRDRAPISTNSPRWEYGATISGNYILFARNERTDSIVLFNRKTGNVRTLASGKSRGGYPAVSPGQVNGDFAVFVRCGKANLPKCDVFRYRISTRKFIKIPNRRPVQYAASVTRTGTVYFAGSGRGCGTNVQIYRRRKGKTSRIADLGGKNDAYMTQVAPRFGGGTDVYFPRQRCKGKRALPPHGDIDILRVKG